MTLTYELSEDALQRLPEEIKKGIRDDEWSLEVDLDELPEDAWSFIQYRLLDDQYVCKGYVDAWGQVVIEKDDLELLIVDGTTVEDLIAAVRQDQRMVEVARVRMAEAATSEATA